MEAGLQLGRHGGRTAIHRIGHPLADLLFVHGPLHRVPVRDHGLLGLLFGQRIEGGLVQSGVGPHENHHGARHPVAGPFPAFRVEAARHAVVRCVDHRIRRHAQVEDLHRQEPVGESLQFRIV